MLCEATTFEPEIWIPPTIQSEDGFSSGFLPPDIAGLCVWLKSDAGTGATSDGDAVTTWTDQSGNGVSPTQATAGFRPTFKTSIQNGLPVVRFTKASFHKLGVTFTGLRNLSGRTVFIVFRQAATGVSQNLLGVTAAGGSVCDVLLQPWNDGLCYDSIGAANFGGFIFGSASFALVESVFDGSLTGNANRLKLYWNAVQRSIIGFSGTIPSSTSATSDTFEVGTAFSNPTVTFGGDVAEILIYNTALSSTDRQAVETYLNSKWAIY